MQLTIKLAGLDQVTKQFNSLTGEQMTGALAAALNKTAAKGQTEVNRAVTERYNIKASEVRNSVTLRKASAANNRLEAWIQIFGSPKKSGRSLNVIHFLENKVTLAEGRRRSKNGTLNQLHFNFIKDAGGKIIPGAFIGNNGRTVFQREGKSRLPIKPVQVIGVGQMFNFNPVRERVINRIESEFKTELQRAIDAKIRGNI